MQDASVVPGFIRTCSYVPWSNDNQYMSMHDCHRGSMYIVKNKTSRIDPGGPSQNGRACGPLFVYETNQFLDKHGIYDKGLKLFKIEGSKEGFFNRG